MKLFLNSLPIDILREISAYLTIDSLASLYATFDKRMQKSILFSGFSTSLVVTNSDKSTQGALSYLFKTVPLIESVQVVSKRGLSKTMLLELSNRHTLHTLSFNLQVIDTSYFSTYSESAVTRKRGEIPFYEHPSYVVLDLNSLFRFVTDLTLNITYSTLIHHLYPIESVAGRLKAIEVALSCLPRNLTRLNLVLSGAETLTVVDTIKQLAPTIQDLCIDLDGVLTTSDSLFRTMAVHAQNVKHLRLFCKTVTKLPIDLAPIVRTTESPLETLEMSSFNTGYLSLADTYWSWSRNVPNLTSLTLWYSLEKTAPYPISVALDRKLPNLLSLKLFRVSFWARKNQPMFSTFPTTLTYLEVSATIFGIRNPSNFGTLMCLRQLPCLLTLIERNDYCDILDTIPFTILPDSLTKLHMEGFGLVEHHIDSTMTQPIDNGSAYVWKPMGDDELMAYLTGHMALTNLTCPISSFRYLHAFRRTHPTCYIESIPSEAITHFPESSWRRLEEIGCFDQGTSISDEKILSFISEQLGPLTNACLSLRSASTAQFSNQRHMVHTLKMGSLPLTSHMLTINFGTLSPYFLGEYPNLHTLDISTYHELKPELLPKTLTSLNLRATTLTVPLLSKCFELPLLVRLSANGKATTPDISHKTRKNWIVFNVPNLSISQRLLPLLLSEQLEILCCSISTPVPDFELQQILEQFNPQVKVSLSCSISLTGKLTDPEADHATYKTIYDYVWQHFTKKGIVITEMTMKAFCFPDGITSLNLDNSEAPTNLILRGELIRKFPATLKTLRLSKTGFEISWRKLSTILPPSLEEFYCSPACFMHDLDKIAPLKNLKTLKMSWPKLDDASQANLEFDLSSMISLTELEIYNLKIVYPLHQAMQSLTNLRHLKIPKIDDFDIYTVFHGHPAIESVVVDTLYISGRCIPERTRLDWVSFMDSSLNAILPIVRYNSISLLQPIAFQQPNIQEIYFNSTDADLLQDKGAIANLVRHSDFSIFPTDLPLQLSRLEFSSASTTPFPWSMILNVLTKASNLKYVKLEMEIDFTIGTLKPLLPPLLESLIMPNAYSRKKDGAELILPPTVTELNAPLLAIKITDHPIPIFENLVIANLAMVRRHQSIARRAGGSSTK